MKKLLNVLAFTIVTMFCIAILVILGKFACPILLACSLTWAVCRIVERE